MAPSKLKIYPTHDEKVAHRLRLQFRLRCAANCVAVLIIHAHVSWHWHYEQEQEQADFIGPNWSWDYIQNSANEHRNDLAEVRTLKVTFQ